MSRFRFINHGNYHYEPQLLHNQFTSYVGMRVYANVGYTNYADISILNLFPIQTYVKPSFVANILSLDHVTNTYGVSMNTKLDPSMYMNSQGKQFVLINFNPASTTSILTTSMPRS